MTPQKIEYADDISLQTVHIDITLGNLCNWACSYCPTNLNDGSLPWLGKDTLINFLNKATTHYKTLGKKYFDFNFLGGETTLYKDFIPIVSWIKDQNFYSNIEIMTNGSRKIGYWNKNIRYFDTISITHHVENADPYHTRQVADLVIDNGKYANVSIPMLPKQWNKCIEHANIILESNHQFNVSPKTLLHDFGGKNIPYHYTKEQKEVLTSKFRFDIIEGRKKFRKGINPHKIIAMGENCFMDYTCYAGVDIIAIDKKGNLKLGGNCKMHKQGFTQKKYYEDDIIFPTEPIICKQTTCNCLPDIQTRKYA